MLRAPGFEVNADNAGFITNIGVVEDARGLFVRGRIMDWSPESRLAQAASRAGALDGLSIGYRAARARRQGRLRVLSAVELWEVSLVTFPMLPGARFQLSRP